MLDDCLSINGIIIAILSILVLIIIGVVLTGNIHVQDMLSPEHDSHDLDMIKLGNWNLQRFGTKKADNDTIMIKYLDIINDYDIMFVQEITDDSGLAFDKLCVLLHNYSCVVSSRAGSTSYKEQYGVIYRNDIDLVKVQDLNSADEVRWERPPYIVKFNYEDLDFYVYNIHIKPDEVVSEMEHLEDIVVDVGNTIVLGDLNADCDYYDNSKETHFEDGWHWLIPDSWDTTVSHTDCAYDRIIVNDGVKDIAIDWGVDNRVSPAMSDHRIVWVRVKV